MLSSVIKKNAAVCMRSISDFGMSTIVATGKPGHDYEGWSAKAGGCLRQLPAYLARNAKLAGDDLEVLHGVEYLEAALRAVS